MWDLFKDLLKQKQIISLRMLLSQFSFIPWKEFSRFVKEDEEKTGRNRVRKRKGR